MSAPEFSRPRRLDTLGDGAQAVSIAAEPAERAALAKRFGLLSLESLAAELQLRRTAAGVEATGRVTADATQPCIATGVPVPAHIDEAVALRFVPEPTGSGGDDEVELGEGDLDTVFFSGGAIDLGEAAAETLALALDPYPRSAQAESTLREAGVVGEEDAKGSAAFAGLKDLLKK